MNKAIEELFSDTPSIIESTAPMLEANEAIPIYAGEFILNNGGKDFKIQGKIYFNWVPNLSVIFDGEIEATIIEANEVYKNKGTLNLYVESFLFGKCVLVGINFGSDKASVDVKGIMDGSVIKGDKSTAVEKLRFAVPNLRTFHGSSVKIINKGITCSKNRLTLENDDYTIIIDQCHNYSDLMESLVSKGGYINLFGGEIVSKNGLILLDKIKDTLKCLDYFLSFMNGSFTSCLFVQGICNDQIVWTDYTDYHVDLYKFVLTWPANQSIEGINESWVIFYNLWKGNEGNKSFLKYAINWYIIANRNSAFIEGSIMIVQTALELIYNWLIIENKKMLVGKDSENIMASNKIRLILGQINESYSVPNGLEDLTKYISENKEIIDAPDAIVQIRNAIVHSQEVKRKKLREIPEVVKMQALRLSIYYIEMSLLHILKYKGIYMDRCIKKMRKSTA